MLKSQSLIPAGKTILASAIIDVCKQLSPRDTCFFYCRNDDATGSSPVGIIKGLVEQLLCQHPDLLPLCHSRKLLSGEPVLRSLNLATRMLQDFCSILDKIFIIVDGLDECSPVERRQTLDTLMELVAECDLDVPGKLRLLVVSQDYADIRRTFSGSSHFKTGPRVIQISHEDNEKDIQTFVKSWVDRIATKFELEKDVTEYLINLTVANAKGNFDPLTITTTDSLTDVLGMFLFAKLVMSNLYDQATLRMLLEAIKTVNFPTELKDA